MATTFKPFGLKPAYHPSGLDRATPFVGTNSYTPGSGDFTAPYSLSAGQAFYQYQPVAVNASGQLTIAASQRLPAPFTVYLTALSSPTPRAVALWLSGPPSLRLTLRPKSFSGSGPIPRWCTKLRPTARLRPPGIGSQYNFETALVTAPPMGTPSVTAEPDSRFAL
jgi:hypothetical protein